MNESRIGFDPEEEKDEKNIIVDKFIETSKRYEAIIDSEASSEEIDAVYQEFSQSVEDINDYFTRQNGEPKFENWPAFLKYFKSYSSFAFEVSNQCYQQNVKPMPILQNMMVETALTSMDISEERKQLLTKIAEKYKVDFSDDTPNIKKTVSESEDNVQFAEDIDKLRSILIIQETLLRGPGSVFERSFQEMAMDLNKLVLVREISDKIKAETPQELIDLFEESSKSFHEVGNASQNTVTLLGKTIRMIKSQQQIETTETSADESYSEAMDILKDEFDIDIRAIVQECV